MSQNSSWKQRELARFRDKTYLPPPWIQVPWFHPVTQFPLHFAHISTSDPSKVAYTPSNEYGERDRHVCMKPGRYLNKFFKDILSPEDIRSLSAKFSVSSEGYKLYVTTSPDEIEQVYTNGPPSCMSSNTYDYLSHIHPSRVYGNSPDLALAYLTNSDDEICSRCIIWPDRKLYSTIYGDVEKMVQALFNDKYGATTEFGFYGARIRKIACTQYPTRFVMPFIDHTRSLKQSDSQYFTFCNKKGTILCRTLNGISGNPKDKRCDNCQETTFVENLEHIVDVDEDWCLECVHNFSLTCCNCKNLVRYKSHFSLILDDYVCQDCYQEECPYVETA